MSKRYTHWSPTLRVAELSQPDKPGVTLRKSAAAVRCGCIGFGHRDERAGNTAKIPSLEEWCAALAGDPGARQRITAVGFALPGREASTRRDGADAGDFLSSRAGLRGLGVADPAAQRPRPAGPPTAGPLASRARPGHVQLRREPDPRNVGAELAARVSQRAVEQYPPALGGHRQRLVLCPTAARTARVRERRGAGRRHFRVSP